MNRASEEALKVSLTETIQEWLDDDVAEVPLPYLGENTAEIMASAALAVLRGIQDTEDYLTREKMLKA